MPLVCSLPTSTTNPFSFVDCASVNISYAITGLANVSFTVVSTSQDITLSDYTEVTFGQNKTALRTVGGFSSGRIKYTGYITSYEVSLITGTLVYEHKIQLIAWGCKA